jgi:hypothetical protein
MLILWASRGLPQSSPKNDDTTRSASATSLQLSESLRPNIATCGVQPQHPFVDVLFSDISESGEGALLSELEHKGEAECLSV